MKAILFLLALQHKDTINPYTMPFVYPIHKCYHWYPYLLEMGYQEMHGIDTTYVLKRSTTNLSGTICELYPGDTVITHHRIQ